MRIVAAVLFAAFAAFALGAAAQSTERPRPPGTMPLDAPPPPPLVEHPQPVPARTAAPQALPQMVDPEPQITKGSAEPQVTERIEGDNRIQEYRLNGKLYMQKVTPKHGKTYVLMDQKGDGTFSRLDQSLDSQVRVPQWVLWEF